MTVTRTIMDYEEIAKRADHAVKREWDEAGFKAIPPKISAAIVRIILKEADGYYKE